MPQPYLLLDCYYDERGASPNFLALLGEEQAQVVRCVYEAPPKDLGRYAGLLISGSKGSLNAPEPWMAAVLETIRAAKVAGLPTLGICFGHQAIARALLGERAVRSAALSELGWVEVQRSTQSALLAGLSDSFTCFASHFDEVTPECPELTVIATTERCPVAGYQIGALPIWGLQFHPEMDPDESEQLVRNNLPRHSGLKQDVEATLATRVDGRHLGARIFANYLELAREARAAQVR